MLKVEIEGNQKIWNSFIDETYPLLRTFEFHNIPLKSDKFVVMVEPRAHPHLEYVLRNVMYFLGPEWGLQIFVGQKNKQFVDEIVRHWENVYIYQLEIDNLDALAYNQLKKSPDFWELINGEHILWVEPDCLLCRSNIDDFLEYDYVGAPWNSKMALAEKVRVGNGGLSLRRKSSMMKISASCNTSPGIFQQEDLFFSVNMMLQNKKYGIPDLEVAQKFSVESVYYPAPFGLHKAWKYLPEEQLKLLLQTINYGN